MEWQAVESSQISHVGYDAASETLGIKFMPTKKQAATGQPGSEYHYAHVSAEVHTQLMSAESIGKYFGEVIKPFPSQYPFFKVELVITEDVL